MHPPCVRAISSRLFLTLLSVRPPVCQRSVRGARGRGTSTKESFLWSNYSQCTPPKDRQRLSFVLLEECTANLTKEMIIQHACLGRQATNPRRSRSRTSPPPPTCSAARAAGARDSGASGRGKRPPVSFQSTSARVSVRPVRFVRYVVTAGCVFIPRSLPPAVRGAIHELLATNVTAGRDVDRRLTQESLLRSATASRTDLCPGALFAARRYPHYSTGGGGKKRATSSPSHPAVPSLNKPDILDLNKRGGAQSQISPRACRKRRLPPVFFAVILLQQTAVNGRGGS